MEINVASLHLRARVVFSSEDERRRWTSVFAATQKKLKKQLLVQAQEAGADGSACSRAGS